MPRGVSSSIQTELNRAQMTTGVFYLFNVYFRSGTRYFDQRGATYNGHTYEARILDIGGIGFKAGEPNSIDLTLNDMDGVIAALDLVESFANVKVEIVEYLPGLGTGASAGHVKATAWLDEVTEMTETTASLTMHTETPTMRIQVPRGTVRMGCRHTFGDTSQYVDTIDFGGSMCLYNLTGTRGSRTTINALSSIDAVTDPVTFDVDALPADANSVQRTYKISDLLLIGSEKLLITAAGAISGGKQSITAKRAQLMTVKASHAAGASVLFANCQKTTDACLRRWMYGNNTSDTYSGGSRRRNYFGGIPIISGYEQGKYRTESGKKATNQRISFSGNESAYDKPLPLPYGKCRINNPPLLVAKAEGDFLTTLWAPADGVLATNSTDSSQATPLNAYTNDPTYAGDKLIRVNGAPRHDRRPGYGIEVFNGDMDRPEPGSVFFPTTTDFTTDRLGLWGVARVCFRIDTKNNPSVDLQGGNVTGNFGVEYGRLVHVYSTPSTYTEKWCEANPAWVQLDVERHPRVGSGKHVSLLNLQSFIDQATHNNELVTDTVNGGTVKRWTFNGVLDERKSYQEWSNLIAMGQWALPPFVDINGTYKIKPIKSESLSGLTTFSDKDAVSRNILWGEDGKTTLKRFRRPIEEVPNQIVVSYIDSSDFAKVTIYIDDEPSQTLPDGSKRVITRSYDLPGTSTLDEAARWATRMMRCGEKGAGGLSNNFGIRWKSFYKDSSNVELADIVIAESNKLDAANQRYFRITDIQDEPFKLDDGSILFVRTFEAFLHDNAMYDDSAYTITKFDRIDGFDPSDAEPPAVTGYTITDLGFADANGTLMTRLTVNYTEPSPKSNFRSVVILRSNDDGAGNAVGDWRFVGEVFATGESLEYAVTGNYEHFAAVSRTLAGHIANVDTQDAAGAKKYPRQRILVDGKADSPLPTPSGLTAAGRNDAIYLEWNAYTGNDRHVFKRFNVYRGTTNDPLASSEIAQSDSNRYRDDSATILANPTTTYYYFVRGVSWLEGVTIAGSLQNGLSNFSSEAHDNSGTDTGVPSAPPDPTVARETAEMLVIGVDAGSTNYDTVESWDIQVTTDPTFVSFPASNSLNKTISRGLPDIVEFQLDIPGVYSIRARARNIFGAGAWSFTTTYVSTASLNVQDSDIPDAPVSLSLAVASGGNPIAGNAYQVRYKYPAVNVSSVWGRSVFFHTSSTLPSPTTAYDSVSGGVTGTLVPGDNRFYITGTPFSVNQWTTPNTHDVIIFSPKRTGSPGWSLESMLYVAKISGNGTNYLDLDFSGSRQIHNYSGLKFYIVQQGGSNHVWEKVSAYKINDPDNVDIRLLHTVDFALQATSLYAHVCLHSLIWGAGKLATSSSASFAGLISTEIGTDSVTTSKLLASNVTSAKISVSQLSAISADVGSITAGTVTGALLRSASSGARIEIQSGSNGFRAYDSSGNLQVRIGGASGSTSIGMYFAGTVDGSGTGIFGTNVSVDGYVGGKEVFAFVDPGTSTTVSPIYALYNNVLKQCGWYDDGLGHRYLAITP